MRGRRRRFVGGFTLVEVLLAAVIGLFVALVAVGALKTASLSNGAVDEMIERRGELRYAGEMVAEDLRNVYRDGESQYMEFSGMVDEAGRSVLKFYTVSMVKARQGWSEGDVYEVCYFVDAGENGGKRLMRRYWPNPNKEDEGLGILSVVGDADLFEVRYFDGEQWQMSWPVEREQSRGMGNRGRGGGVDESAFGGLPEMVEVTMVKVLADEADLESGSDERLVEGRDFLSESFLCNFARASGMQLEETEEGTTDTSDSYDGGSGR